MAASAVIWTLKPSLLSILTRQFYFLLMFSAVVIALTTALNMANAEFSHIRTLLYWAGAVILARLTVETLIWRATSFTLTATSIITRRGVLQRSLIEVQLSQIQHLELFRTVRERMIGAGTLGIGTGAGIEAVINTVSDPDTVLASIRARMNHGSASARPPVIGLVGAIGAGKSTLASIFRNRGCLVLDSDSAAKEALKRPEVISTIISWWGESILDGQGQIDRRKLADLVFTDPAKRKQLEGLTHPLLKADRIAAIGASGNIPAVIIDAPLLFEAGVDRECDQVICVDAPLPLRIERVKVRGWSPADLARRESAQISIEEKRRRSTWVIENTSSPESLAVKADEILARLATSTPRHQ